MSDVGSRDGCGVEGHAGALAPTPETREHRDREAPFPEYRGVSSRTTAGIKPSHPSLEPTFCDGRPIVVLCGWCEGAREELVRREAEGYAVSSTICAACREREFGDLGKRG